MTRVAARLYELALVGVSLAFIDASDPDDELVWLVLWDLLALVYVVVGAVGVRRSRLGPDPAPPVPARARVLRPLTGRRFSFLFTFMASATGLYAAVVVVVETGSDDALDTLLRGAAVPATVLAWTLLHAGYARFYAALYHRDGTGFEFPHTPHPGRVDLLYFAFAVGTSFAASDVNVTNRELRWHVTVHSVLSFFYNAAVLAIAIRFLTGG